MNWLFVFLGGGLGCVTRFGMGKIILSETKFPLATLSANALAAAIIGVLWYFQTSRTETPSYVWPLLATGFCGGLSTYSTFSLETVQLFRDGTWNIALLNILLNTVICVALVWLISKILA
jgi:fluoride exporter